MSIDCFSISPVFSVQLRAFWFSVDERGVSKTKIVQLKRQNKKHFSGLLFRPGQSVPGPVTPSLLCQGLH